MHSYMRALLVGVFCVGSFAEPTAKVVTDAEAADEQAPSHVNYMMRNSKTKHHHSHLGSDEHISLLGEGKHSKAHDAAAAVVASKAVRGILVAKETAHVLSEGSAHVSVESDGAVSRQYKPRLHKNKKKAKCVDNGRDRACVHYSGRFRPSDKHHSDNLRLKKRADVVNATPDPSVLFTGDGGNGTGPGSPNLTFSTPTPFYQNLPLPTTVSCQLAVDDTLLGISYNGIPIPGQIATAMNHGAAANPTKTCMGLYQFSFTPVPGAALLISAMDGYPGTGQASCAGIGIVCYATLNQTWSNYSSPAFDKPTNPVAGGMVTAPYVAMNTYFSWSIAASPTPFQKPPTAFNLVGPGTSSSAACGIDPNVMNVIMWQDSMPYVVAAWTTPSGPLPTTTTTTSTAMNMTKAGAFSSTPGMLQACLVLLLLRFLN